jgi:hypothetical protein
MKQIGGADKAPEKLVEEIFTKQSECAFNKNQGPVCSPKQIVDTMAKYLNINSNNQLEIVNKMKETTNCNSESCIYKNPKFLEFAKLSKSKNILDEFFKPHGPATHFGLLSNFNIDNVLEQLHEKHPDFLHIPFQMRDFEKVGSELARVDLAKEFRNGIKRFGVVLNTDVTTGRGIHWYCLYGEKINNKIQLEYFNSSGREPLPETQAWLQKTKHYLAKELKIPVDVKYTTGIQFQNDEHSCGVYCLMYIWLRLEGIDNEWFNTENFNDSVMHQARKVLFRLEV